MNKTIALLLTLFLYQLSFAQVNHSDFETGLVISLDENYQLDINGDGISDLNVNSLEGQLGFDPIPTKGCMGSNYDLEPNEFGSLPLKTFAEGELIQWISADFSWSEDDETSAYSNTLGFDNGWTNEEYKYVGFMLLDGFKASCGWMKVQINEEEQLLIIKELAYQDDFHSAVSAGIYAGELTQLDGTVSTSIKTIVKMDIVVFPNPASEIATIYYEMPESNKVDFEIIDLLGRKVYAEQIQENRSGGLIDLDLSNYSSGTYFVKLSSPEEQIVKQLKIK